MQPGALAAAAAPIRRAVAAFFAAASSAPAAAAATAGRWQERGCLLHERSPLPSELCGVQLLDAHHLISCDAGGGGGAKGGSASGPGVGRSGSNAAAQSIWPPARRVLPCVFAQEARGPLQTHASSRPMSPVASRERRHSQRHPNTQDSRAASHPSKWSRLLHATTPAEAAAAAAAAPPAAPPSAPCTRRSMCAISSLPPSPTASRWARISCSTRVTCCSVAQRALSACARVRARARAGARPCWKNTAVSARATPQRRAMTYA